MGTTEEFQAEKWYNWIHPSRASPWPQGWEQTAGGEGETFYSLSIQESLVNELKCYSPYQDASPDPP